jgi:hypothetical protein
MEEYLMAYLGSRDSLQPEFTSSEFLKGPVAALLVPATPGSGSYQPRTGDVLLVRGGSYVSSAIARITEIDSLFSHLAIIYVDPRTQTPWIVESLIETGLKITEWKYYSENKNLVRATIFRYPEQEVARRAGSFIYERASFPQYPSRVTGGPEIVGSMFGVTVEKTFAPSDMDVETRFDLVADWRNPAIHATSYIKDIVTEAMYHRGELPGPRELTELLEQLRLADLETYKQHQKLPWVARRLVRTQFHHFLKPVL